MRVLCLLTCHNRKKLTENCIRSISDGNDSFSLDFIVVDDNSQDGTQEMLETILPPCHMMVLHGDGNLYYSGGMRKAMEYALKNLEHEYEYVMLLNDDVLFFADIIKKMIRQSEQQEGAVIVGAIIDEKGELSYSAVKYGRRLHYSRLKIEQWSEEADTFNANCVLIPFGAFVKCGAIDKHYIHSLGDFDYGMTLKRAGYKIYVSKEYCGVCNRNDTAGTWTDRSLKRRERFFLKESAKGAPTKQWFYFLKKNFGIVNAIIGCTTPYIRIALKK